jgi:hypothetical protein
MASFKTTIIIRLMTLWNLLCDFYNNTLNSIIIFYDHFKDYIQGNNDIWLFIPNHSIPIPLSIVNNLVEANWVYYKCNNILNLNMVHKNQISCKFSWLSTKIKITDSITHKITEYYIDDFLESFIINTKEKYLPSLYIIFMTWCAYNKHWFKADDIVEFEIINDMGDSMVLNIDENNYTLNIRLNKIYVIVDPMSNTDNKKEPSIFYIENSENT